MDKKAELEVLAKHCELRFNRGASASWKHSDYGDLSREILLDTGVAISPNTLKRIFGKISVDDDYLPQQATIDALRAYSRYQESEERPAAQPGQDPVVTSPRPAADTAPVGAPPVMEIPLGGEQAPVIPKSGGWRSNKLVLVVVLLAVLVAGGLLLAKWRQPEASLSGRISLKEIEGVLPATAFFNIEVPASKDSLFVGFGDKTPWAYVTPDQKVLAHNYLFPGVFKVEMLNRQKIPVTHMWVSILSYKWIGLGYRRQADLPDRYYEFHAAKSGPDSLFHISNPQLLRAGLDTVGSFFTRLTNFTPLKGVNPDNFIFETTFKNLLHEKGIYCHSTQFQITGIENKIRFKLVSPGCSFRVVNVISEQSFEGTKTNLSNFAMELGNWNTARLENRNKEVSFYVNERLLYTGKYQQSLGELQGVFLEFEGNGFVKTCELKTLEGKSLYRF